MQDLLFGLLFIASTGALIYGYQRLVFWAKVWLITRKLNQALKGSQQVEKQVADFGKTHHE